MPTREEKIIKAHEYMYQLMSRHEEWERYNKSWNAGMVEMFTDNEGKHYEVLVNFDRCGTIIFRQHDDEYEDEDDPEFIGGQILYDMGQDALKQAGLGDGSINVMFGTQEKGGLSVYFIDTTDK